MVTITKTGIILISTGLFLTMFGFNLYAGETTCPAKNTGTPVNCDSEVLAYIGLFTMYSGIAVTFVGISFLVFSWLKKLQFLAR